ncbi:MAG: metal-dependent transcriptional regulator [Algoriphagus sp.]|jgi:DtxR family Mn-dependent transcriptional regulator|uniref:metal-dependent transcriptional regulator n=1 Tax=Algoriphagus sp. TaxID=1872435 RepID=UPI002722C67F|nr:metal-dependent transcriptional regulator [Algoriphagus sp.]MDO8967916.1 metal-dependent transcriptional regulator [Algoriphagus sp.]MDP2040361.1 metal-dependent transcriptional regulator [Algoriphagus sp.]MDP3201117.1 metal-dependent transcriptional regulator [Algoriphagus sp.]MDP3472698.1 metal-dependent transcriptional regulator [Algoriphagus sp.]
MASSTEENYLKALYNLSNGQGEVNISDLANGLKVSMPTANSMVKSLQKSDWVIYEKYKPVILTPKGQKEAALIVRKHRLTEMFLVKKMGFGWEEVHEVAEQIEHIHAPKFFERMDEMLGHPTIDPHGSPIPDNQGRMQEFSYTPLSSCKPNQTVQLTALTNSSTEFLEFLNSRKLSLGVHLKVISREAYDQSIVVSYPDHPMETLSEKVSERLLVRVLE